MPLNNGPEGIRTLGLCVANAALSQLSYEPVLISYLLYRVFLKITSFFEKIKKKALAALSRRPAFFLLLSLLLSNLQTNQRPFQRQLRSGYI